MVKCWARAIGGCSSIQSAEHYISKSLFPEDSITVRGLPWVKGDSQTVGKASLKAKILCTTHNTALSELDSYAKTVFATLKEVQRLNDVRARLRPRGGWSLKRYRLDGLLFERWAVKTLIGLFCTVGKGSSWDLTQSEPLDPPLIAVEAAFGRCRLEKPMGLYTALAIGEVAGTSDGLDIETLFDEGGLVGAILLFWGFRFLIWVDDERVSPFTTGDGFHFGPSGESIIHHHKTFEFLLRRSPSQVIEFLW